MQHEKKGICERMSERIIYRKLERERNKGNYRRPETEKNTSCESVFHELHYTEQCPFSRDLGCVSAMRIGTLALPSGSHRFGTNRKTKSYARKRGNEQ